MSPNPIPLGTVLTHVVRRSSNSKLGDMAATYRTVSSCPTTCPLMNNGCYANGRIFAIAGKYGTDSMAAIASLADELPIGGALRLNVSGDFLLPDGSLDLEYVDACNALALARPDVRFFAYSHAWRNLTPGVFNFVVNASCETAEDVAEAAAAGWQTVIVSDVDLDETGGQRVTQCPNQTHGVTCADCRLCSSNAPNRSTVRFGIHGSGSAKARRVIENLDAAPTTVEAG